MLIIPGAAAAHYTADGAVPSAAEHLERGRAFEQRGQILDAIQEYQGAIACAARVEPRVMSEVHRRLGALRRRRHELDDALACCRRSLELAREAADEPLIAEALNGLALVHFWRGEWEEARRDLSRALEISGTSPSLRGGIEQNLGVMANAEGDLDEALRRYQRSLEAFQAARERRGCAIAYHNLGMISADREMWGEADASFRRSLAIAEQIGDVNLRGHVLLNRTEVHLARQSFEEARLTAEEALSIFEQIGARDLKADAYKFLGILYRETGKPTLAEARLKTAMELATDAGATLAQAEVSRELAVLYQQMGRNQETLRLLTASHRLFTRLNARRDLVDVAAKTAHLEHIYLEIVKQWGGSIESSDTYTHGHSERVGDYAVQVAEALGISGHDLTGIRVGAYLHDLGKVRVPHEILNKAGRLTPDEFAVMKMHPIWGIEMLAAIDFPWDIRPIIRSHHEKLDGSGYPDGLRGDEIAMSAQVIGIVDMFDALTTTRSYRAAMSEERAIEILRESVPHFRPDVFDAFMATLGGASRSRRAA